MLWLAFGIAMAGLFVGLGLESLGECIIFALGQQDEWEKHKAKKKDGDSDG